MPSVTLIRLCHCGAAGWWLTGRLAKPVVGSRRSKQKCFVELGSFPRVQIVFSGDEGFIWAYTAEEIKRLLPSSENEGERRLALAELAKQRLDWNAVDIRVGYSKAKETEAENADLEDKLFEALWRTAPQSFVGIAAKLHCVLETEDPGSDLQDAPWPQLRTILAELVRIAAPDN